jgi:adenosylhomocysteine nucleosidase
MKIAIIAAMEREVASLVRGWKVRTLEHAGRRYRLFENGKTVVVWGGIGADAARRATEAVIRDVQPGRVVSAGFAGALDESMHVGDLLEPRFVINAADGVRTDVGSGNGILVTSSSVADKEQKRRLAKAYGAHAVDMEAAAVAQGAEARGIDFGALKVVSDDSNFDMPVLDLFVAEDGVFRTGSFIWYVVMRPWLWVRTLRLARNSARAQRALFRALTDYLGRESLAQQPVAAGRNL